MFLKINDSLNNGIKKNLEFQIPFFFKLKVDGT